MAASNSKGARRKPIRRWEVETAGIDMGHGHSKAIVRTARVVTDDSAAQGVRIEYEADIDHVIETLKSGEDDA